MAIASQCESLKSALELAGKWGGASATLEMNRYYLSSFIVMQITSNRAGQFRGWSAIVPLTLGFWLSGSLVLDLVVLPSLASMGMMSATGFASAGYALFGTFNRIELLCAAFVLTGCLVLQQRQVLAKRSLVLALLLLGIALGSTYILTPVMSGLSLSLDWFETNPEMPAAMVPMHLGYWGLEVGKLVCGSWLLFGTDRSTDLRRAL